MQIVDCRLQIAGRRVVAAAALALAVAGPAGAQAPEVAVTGGKIRGFEVPAEGAAVRAYLGIPFAAPPVGALRWRPPQPVKPWEGVRECREFAASCPQPRDAVYGIGDHPQSEDCLYLNVWTAAKEPGAKLPVMVWIHGGGNVIGGASSPVYDGRHFAAAGVVLVSIQYRLGAFGYLAHPALTAEAKALDGQAASGNYGLMDQIAALKWVRENIAKFGGDPERVTIFGESAGAANVTTLMASPLAAGLFQRAIAESGYFGPNTPALDKAAGRRGHSAHEIGLEVAKRLGVTGEGPAALAALRALPAEKLVSLPLAVGTLRLGRNGEGALRLGPVVDGYVLPEAPQEVWEAGKMARVPFMAGSLQDDGSVFTRALPPMRLMGYRLVMRTLFGADANAALQAFPAATDADVPAAVRKVATVMAFTAPARRLVRWVEQAGGNAWLYHFSRRPDSARAGRDGVFHGLEIPYVFNTMTAFGGPADRALAKEMQARWVAFARDGDPNPPDMQPAWPQYHKAEDRHLEFGDTVRVGERLEQAACDVADRRGNLGQE